MRYAEDYLAAGFSVMLYSPDGITPRGPWLRPGHIGMVPHEQNGALAIRWPDALVVESRLDLIEKLEGWAGERFSHLILGAKSSRALLTVPYGYVLSAAVMHRLQPITFEPLDLYHSPLFAPPSFEMNSGLRRFEWRDEPPSSLPPEPSSELLAHLESAFVVSKSMTLSGIITAPTY